MENQFSGTSRKRLNQCHPDLQALFEEVIKYRDITIICGHRDANEQDKAYNEGNSTLQFPKSKHNKQPSLAVDVAPYHIGKPHIHWYDESEWIEFGEFVYKIYENLYKEGKIKSIITWGGNWSNFKDYPHWQVEL